MQTERIYSFLLTAAMLTAVICSEPAFADGCSSPTFVQAPAIRLAWIGSVYAVVVGDFDGDGTVDLAVDGSVVSMHPGVGDGTFRPPVTVFVQGFSTLAAADFNSDGHLDLVVGGTWPYSEPDWLLLGNGDGTFIARQIDAPADLVGDFNLDGKPDLAGGLNKNVNGQSDVYVSLGKGDGSLSSAGRYAATLYGRNVIAGGDLNNDGTPDLVILEDGTVAVLLNDGTGTFLPGPSQPLPGNDVVVGDFNGDGKADLVVANSVFPSTRTITMLLGNGDGSFRPGDQIQQDVYPLVMRMADLNGDGKQDLALLSSGNVEVLLGNGDGTFQPATQVFTATNNDSLYSLTIADLNGDAASDLVIGSNFGMVYLLVNNCVAKAPPTILTQPIDQIVYEGTNVSFSVTATAFLPFSFQWQFNGTNISGATEGSLTLPAVQVSDSGDYTVVISTKSASVTSSTARLQVHPNLPASGVVAFPDELSFQTALQSGFPLTFGFNGTIPLSHTVVITTNTTLDASGRSVSLDGNHAVRHFVVTNGATLRLINLNLINGKFAGALGDTNQSGNPGWGGSIYNAGGTLELSGCSFTNNQAFGGDGGPPVLMWPDIVTGGPTAGAPAYGGAIYSIDGAVWATNCSFANNRVQGGQGQSGDSLNGTYTGPGGDCYGGAIFTTNSAVSLVSVSFSNNLAQAGEKSGGRPWAGGGRSYGGALADASGTTTLVTNCAFVGNRALGAENVEPGGSDEGSANAGALFHDGGTMSVSQTLFSSNSVTGGGGISRGFISITSANGNGGAVFNRAGNLELKSCALLFNKANGGAANDFAGQVGVNGIGSGGAIFNMAFLTLANCTGAENGAVVGLPGQNGTVVSLPGGGALGGFLFNSGGSASLLNVTVADNYATAGASSSLATGASIYNTSGSVTLTNTILLCAPSPTNVSGTLIDGGHNLSSDASAKFTLPTSRNNTDPLLGPLADNGGPTPTRALLLGSPALDAGDNAACPATDQRGIPRPMGSGCDIGAFESARKLSLTRGPQGNVRLDFIFEPGKFYSVKASTNLVDWIQLGTGTSDTNGLFEFKDTSGSQFPRRFYRVE